MFAPRSWLRRFIFNEVAGFQDIAFLNRSPGFFSPSYFYWIELNFCITEFLLNWINNWYCWCISPKKALMKPPKVIIMQEAPPCHERSLLQHWYLSLVCYKIYIWRSCNEHKSYFFLLCTKHLFLQLLYFCAPVSDSEPSSTANCNGHVVKIHQNVPIKAESRRWHLSLHFLTKPEL